MLQRGILAFTIVIYHKYCRKTDKKIGELIYRYHIRRDAFYFKYVLAGDREIASMVFLILIYNAEMYLHWQVRCKRQVKILVSTLYGREIKN